MNLIEQLGGYERAKHEFEMIKEMKPIYPGEIETNDRLLLEYRRQNNIFEVGDKVVGSKLFDDRIFEFQYYLLELSMAVISKDGAAIGLNQLRHATPEEIKAGKRLEANQ
ncbi:hypothetical protein V3519_02245 [Acinetobacter variabilis]|uniref:hypothetical protein n=1 Tax=Acinetobacter variabilis TaxID=70346 RepID=UPI0030FB53AA